MRIELMMNVGEQPMFWVETYSAHELHGTAFGWRGAEPQKAPFC